MVVVVVAVHAVAGLDPHLELARLVVGQRQLRRPEVALAVGGVLQELRALLGDVPRRGKDVRAVGGLDDHESRAGLARLGLVEDHLVDGPFGDDDVVLLPELQGSEHRVHGARSVVHEDALVALAVLVVVVHRLGGHADGHLAVGVAEEHHATGDGITLGLCRHRLEVPHPHRVRLDVLRLRRVERLPSRDLGRGVDVIQRRRGAHEPLGAEDLLGVQGPVRAAELDVPLGR